MKKLFLYFIITFFSAEIKAQSAVTENFKKLQPLVGEWKRTNVKPGRSGIEKWISVSPLELHGVGITMNGSDTVEVEKIRLLIKDNNIFYVADVPGNKTVVYFKLTKISDGEFICENPDHDFPKMISYKIDGEKLKATISGNGRSIDYFFEKKL